MKNFPQLKREILKSFDEEFSHIGWVLQNKRHINEELMDFIKRSLDKVAKEAIEAVRVEENGYICYKCGSDGYNCAISRAEELERKWFEV